jgi:DNA-binding transcriptional LysR family regulator
MEIIQLLSFYEIAKTGSFSKASEYVFRTQSAVSHQIKNLEKELNIELFERLGKRVKLTEGGELLLDIVHSFFNDLEDLKRIYEDIQHGEGGTLTIAASSAVSLYLLPRIIKRFIHQYPKKKFKLVSYHHVSEMISLILSGDAQFGIGPRSDQVPLQKIDFLPWKSFNYILVMPKHHPLSKKKTIKLADIAKHPLILYRAGTVGRNLIEGTLIRNKLPYEIAMEMNVGENIKKYVEMGIGVSILSSISLTYRDKDRFALSNVSNIFGKQDYGICLRKDKYITATMEQFIKFCAPNLFDEFLKLETQNSLSQKLRTANARHASAERPRDFHLTS